MMLEILTNGNDLGTISTMFSICAISCWLVALLPQQYRNYKRKSVRGISPFLLLFLFCADMFNFIGCILTHQLPFQFYNSCYALMNDCVLFFQFWYYSIYLLDNRSNIIENKATKIADNDSDLYREEEDLMESSITSYGSLTNGNLIASGLLMASHVSTSSAAPIFTLTSTTKSSESLSYSAIGQIIACLCACCYISARLPQLYKNNKRKSTNGLSPFFAGTAIVANSFYALSILTSNQFLFNNDPVSKMRFLKNELPYLVGNFGSIILDIVFFYQYFKFGDHRKEESLAEDLSEMIQVTENHPLLT